MPRITKRELILMLAEITREQYVSREDMTRFLGYPPQFLDRIIAAQQRGTPGAEGR